MTVEDQRFLQCDYCNGFYTHLTEHWAHTCSEAPEHVVVRAQREFKWFLESGGKCDRGPQTLLPKAAYPRARVVCLSCGCEVPEHEDNCQGND